MKMYLLFGLQQGFAFLCFLRCRLTIGGLNGLGWLSRAVWLGARMANTYLYSLSIGWRNRKS